MNVNIINVNSHHSVRLHLTISLAITEGETDVLWNNPFQLLTDNCRNTQTSISSALCSSTTFYLLPPRRQCVARTTCTAVPTAPSVTWQPPHVTIPREMPWCPGSAKCPSLACGRITASVTRPHRAQVNPPAARPPVETGPAVLCLGYCGAEAVVLLIIPGLLHSHLCGIWIHSEVMRLHGVHYLYSVLLLGCMLRRSYPLLPSWHSL